MEKTYHMRFFRDGELHYSGESLNLQALTKHFRKLMMNPAYTFFYGVR